MIAGKRFQRLYRLKRIRLHVLSGPVHAVQRHIGGLVILLSIVTCGIYMLYWYYKAGGKVNKIQYLDGRSQDSSLGILYLLLALFGLSIISLALIQSELNKVAAE